jgi:ATP-dependent Lon protease
MEDNIQNYIYKINKLLGIVTNTYNSILKYKSLYFVDSGDVYNCILVLQNVSTNLKNVLSLLQKNTNIDDTSFTLAIEEISRDLLSNIKKYGTEKFTDLLYLCLGSNYLTNNIDKYRLLCQFAHPISYNVIDTPKPTPAEMELNIIDCNDNYKNNTNQVNDYKLFNIKTYCIQVLIYYNKQTFVINCVIDDIPLDILNDVYINNKLIHIATNDTDTHTATSVKQWYNYLNTSMFGIYLNCITLKDILIHSKTAIHKNYAACVDNIKQIPTETLIGEFIKEDLYAKRSRLLGLLYNSEDQESQYIAYLLYDLLSSDSNGIIDTIEQTLLFDSLPFKMKQLFYNAMKKTITYARQLTNIDINNIPIEQRICLLNTTENVKEKAMIKLKEIKAKNEDSGSKARHYLDGLLKIPFKIFKEELILKINQECIQLFIKLMKNIDVNTLPLKDTYNSVEIYKYVRIIKTQFLQTLYADLQFLFENIIITQARPSLVAMCIYINKFITEQTITYTKIKHTNKKLNDMREELITFFQKIMLVPPYAYMGTFINTQEHFSPMKYTMSKIDTINSSIAVIEQKRRTCYKYLTDVTATLDKAVYGHVNAKRQLERIIGQWINGEKTGYCFGFEGPPGVGKTSLAKKGIAHCLRDENGVSRPFAFIAIGGSANGSTLEGHNYTYVGSTWGKIVDILMETKCMNPVIFIDELDKVSKTEHGKEIISILTHLIDPTQNDTFQDKYFNGVDIDVSKILFVFSYNDANIIDSILLDRIHRIKFDNLSLDDKITIAKQFILPEIYKKMGLEDVLIFGDAEIEYIIEEYTAESGVRKLKELLFDIVGEINLELLHNANVALDTSVQLDTNVALDTSVQLDTNVALDTNIQIPIVISKTDIREKYLKNCDEVKAAKIHVNSTVGLINGLWANSLGKGGVLPIEASYFPATSFLELKLTGMQGDVMKESMNVAKTLAWSLLPENIKSIVSEHIQKGLHIHVPEGATPKDGPSAGTAITVVMYSLFTNKKIKHDVAITGEICLSGRVTAIGGLDLKILGGIKAGVKTFIYPQANQKDFLKLQNKYGEKSTFKDIKFMPVDHIEKVLLEVFV